MQEGFNTRENITQIINDGNGFVFSQKIRRKAKVKVLLHYKKSMAELEKARRNEKIAKAKEYIKDNPGIIKMNGKKTNVKYVKEIPAVATTGEVADSVTLVFDEETIREEEKLGGFYCLITSELEYSEKQIKNAYSQLSMIEESFRITKSDLENRPLYVKNEEHLEGRMLETFVALMIIRLIQYIMKENRISAQRIIEVLNSCNCIELT